MQHFYQLIKLLWPRRNASNKTNKLITNKRGMPLIFMPRYAPVRKTTVWFSTRLIAIWSQSSWFWVFVKGNSFFKNVQPVISHVSCPSFRYHEVIDDPRCENVTVLGVAWIFHTLMFFIFVISITKSDNISYSKFLIFYFEISNINRTE